MADYSQFPFDEFSVDEIAQMMLKSVLIGDDEFAIACREQIKQRKSPKRDLECDHVWNTQFDGSLRCVYCKITFSPTKDS